jgi:DNA replication protein DnaC
VITTTRAYKKWARTFANDATLASAVLDRVIHHCETVIIKGKSYRLKDRIDQEDQADPTDSD